MSDMKQSQMAKNRRAEMDKVLTALECWIESIVTDMGSSDVGDTLRRRALREDALDLLSGTKKDG